MSPNLLRFLSLIATVTATVVSSCLCGGNCVLADVPTTSSPDHAVTVLDSWTMGWDRGLTYRADQLIPGSQTFNNVLSEKLPDVQLKGRVGGSLFLDGGYITGQPEQMDRFAGAVRRARIYTAGNYHGFWDYNYKVQFALERESLFLNDFYLEHRFAEGADSVTFGYFDPPVSLEALSSIGDYSLMELPSVVSALAPGMRLGLQYAGSTRKPEFAWAVALSTVGQNGQNEGESDSSPVRGSARLVYLPCFNSDIAERDIVHFGVSTSYLYSNHNTIQTRARPESFLADYAFDTGERESDSSTTAGLEFLHQYDALTQQAEVLGSSVNYVAQRQSSYYGGYYQLAYFLRGSGRSYDPRRGKLLGVDDLPDSRFWHRPLGGAVEIAARVSFLDLNSGAVSGGSGLMRSLGANWYINSRLALRFEYVVANIKKNSDFDATSIFQARLQAHL